MDPLGNWVIIAKEQLQFLAWSRISSRRDVHPSYLWLPAFDGQPSSRTEQFHIGPNTSSKIVSKGICSGKSKNTYRGYVGINAKAMGSRNYSQCDSLLIGNLCNSNTFPFISVQNSTTKIEHEATTSKVSEEQIFYCLQRGISTEKAISLIISGFCDEVYMNLPLEFSFEADYLLTLKIEGSVG